MYDKHQTNINGNFEKSDTIKYGFKIRAKNKKIINNTEIRINFFSLNKIYKYIKILLIIEKNKYSFMISQIMYTNVLKSIIREKEP